MTVDLSIDERGVATVLLNRPTKRNALNQEMLEALAEQVEVMSRNADLRAAVVRGAGGTFCAGADIADWVAPSHRTAAHLSSLGRQTFDALARLPFPTVAAIEGVAVGGGLELALACDIRVSTDRALIGFPETHLGNLPAWGGLMRLVQATNLGVAKYLLLTGILLEGSRAADYLIVHESCPTERLDEHLASVLDSLLAAEPYALELAKGVLRAVEGDMPYEPAMAALTATLDSSKTRKQEFLDRRIRRRQSSSETAD